MPEHPVTRRSIGQRVAVLLCLASAGSAWAAAPAGASAVAATGTPAEPPALLLPVQGITASGLRDTFGDGRDGGQRGHEAIDIPAATGTPVLAVDDGRIVKLFLSQPGGITVYQFDPSGRLAYYYAHLERYADGLAEGQAVRRGSVIGYVGATGNASPDAPHLHFAIFRLGPEKQWWKGEPVNPFTYLGGKPP
ncbi:M23 family metallopeptidase [Polaromonas sp. CG_9.11]|uniref:M23 family metallopeptidase n=1 Tax=Polaromonas sp. CG_9.11 TaxID=2787730 RepID=UPI001A2E79CA|nr:M23 family metallopeptidase [Polaromonas sp. CG_9.11]MBG6074586.1 murein DD-endopeptidase MepM/ murein hydrolase activator NlpD [Polaromonas sp. CG_9.11]